MNAKRKTGTDWLDMGKRMFRAMNELCSNHCPFGDVSCAACDCPLFPAMNAFLDAAGPEVESELEDETPSLEPEGRFNVLGAAPGELEYWDDAVLTLQQGDKPSRVVLGVDAATDYILAAFQISRHTVEPEYIISLMSRTWRQMRRKPKAVVRDFSGKPCPRLADYIRSEGVIPARMDGLPDPKTVDRLSTRVHSALLMCGSLDKAVWFCNHDTLCGRRRGAWTPAYAYAPVLAAAKSAPRHREVNHG